MQQSFGISLAKPAVERNAEFTLMCYATVLKVPALWQQHSLLMRIASASVCADSTHACERRTHRVPYCDTSLLLQDCALSVYKPNPRQYVAKIPQVGHTRHHSNICSRMLRFCLQHLRAAATAVTAAADATAMAAAWGLADHCAAPVVCRLSATAVAVQAERSYQQRVLATAT
jgi:hypothetical protein